MQTDRQNSFSTCFKFCVTERNYVLIANSLAMTVIPIAILVFLNTKLWFIIRRYFYKYRLLKGVFTKNKRGVDDVELNSILIATDFTSICYVYKELWLNTPHAEELGPRQTHGVALFLSEL